MIPPPCRARVATSARLEFRLITKKAPPRQIVETRRLVLPALILPTKTFFPNFVDSNN